MVPVTAPIRVVVADDHELVREGIRTLCEHDGDIRVVATAENGAAAVTAVREHRPDVVLMDVRMPVVDGLEATRRILAEDDEVRVLVLTTYQLDEYLFSALQAGASGFLAKDVPPPDLRAGIRTVAEGQALLSPGATRRLIETFVAERGTAALDDAPLAGLTEREREVLAQVGKGRSNDEIATALFLSPATVKTHVNRAMAKLDAHDRAQLVVLAYRTGLVRPGD